MNPQTKQLELPTQEGNVIVNPGDLIGEGRAGFFIVTAADTNDTDPRQTRQQRRAAEREPRLVVSRIVVYYENGHASEMDIKKVNLVDRATGVPLFNEVIEGE